MARPPITRRIPDHLEARLFKPQGIPMRDLATESLTLDGLEALRLADVEGLYQEAAAERMGISRATFARVLLAARGAVARALVEGRALEIGGGTVAPGPEADRPCPVHGGRRRRGRGCRCGGGRRRRRGGASQQGEEHAG